MLSLKVLLLSFFIASAFCEGDEGGCDKDKWETHNEKIKQYIDETRQLSACCSFPKDETMLEEPECKHFLEGLTENNGKGKHKAYKCFAECIFKLKGIFVDGDLVLSKILEETDKSLADAAEFRDISVTSINYCYGEYEAKKDKWQASWRRHDGENKCSIIPGAFGLCVLGNVVRSCPESNWENSDECNAVKASAVSLEDCFKY